MSAPTEPSATANEPRLPGRSSSWTRSRYEGTRTLFHSARGPAFRPMTTLACRVPDLPRRGSPPGAPRAPGAVRRRTRQLRRPARRHPRPRQPDPSRRRHRRRTHRQPTEGRQRVPLRCRRAVPDPGTGACRGAEVRRGSVRGTADPGGGRMSAELIRLDAATLGAKIAAKEVSSVEATRACLDQIAKTDEKYHAFLHVAEDKALASAAAVDKAVAAGESLPSPLAGVPLALKDVFTTTDMPTTCGSKILEGWTSPYDATVTARLRAAGIPILGKTNMDEFAMGSSTENSAYGPTRNPWNVDRVPGGSGGGSAAALAAFQAPLAIGSDTGGSIRQPAALTATVGVKPTYGTVSRYGLIACASSLDQGGPCARTVLDTALLHEVIAGHDPKDSTSVEAKVPDVVAAARAGASGDLKGVRIGVVKQLRGDGYQDGVLASFNAAVDVLTQLGAEVSEVDCPHFDYALPAYYLILPSEVSSNLARFDGMRYALRVADDGTHSAEEVMALTRAAGFGPEVKRRIMIGTYALSAGYYDAYYNQAQKVRTLIARDLDEAYKGVDVLISPATPTTAFPLGEKVDDPLAMYLFDLCTLPLNLAGHCGMSVPSGLSPDDNLPVGLQIMAPALADDRLYRVGAAYEVARGPLPTAV